ncbi:MAG: PAS domain-containing protein [Bacteroidota bacterium]
MISKQFYLQLIGRVLLLTTSALLLAFCWLSKNAYLVLPIGAIIIVQVISFIAYFNQTNRKIAYLFESIKNEDFSLQFPEHIGLKSFKGLNQSLNQFNQQIRENKIRLEVQEKYYQEILETASIGIFTINSNGHILFANPTVRKVLNLEQLTHIRQLERTASTLFVKLKKLAPFEKQFE